MKEKEQFNFLLRRVSRLGDSVGSRQEEQGRADAGEVKVKKKMVD
jgi:hypothetical protein